MLIPLEVLRVAYQENVKWIVPPGLATTVKQFKTHCTIAMKRRISVLICGNTGTGKSLFLKIYEDIYKKQSEKKNIKVIYLNCSHFAGVDPRIAQAELFGAEKGSATGITSRRIGLLLERNNEKEYRLSYMLESTHHVIKMSMSDLTKSRENIVKNMILPFDFNSIWFDIFYCVTPVSAHKNHPPCFRKFLICWDIK